MQGRWASSLLVYTLCVHTLVAGSPTWSLQADRSDYVSRSCIRGAPAGARPPVALQRPNTLITAAGPVVDNYHWLRDDNHSDRQVLGYLAAENAYSDAALAQLQPLAAKLVAEMEGRLNNITAPVPVRHGSWWYHERQDPGQRYWVRYRRPAVGHSSLGSSSSSSSSTNGATPAGSSSASEGKAGKAAAPPGSTVMWSDPGPDLSAPEQVVLDPNFECQQAAGLASSSSSSSSSMYDSSPEHCDVWGSTVSPDGQLVAFGVDTSGSEQYQLMVRHIGSSKALLPAAIPGTSGDYEWAGHSQALYFVTRNATTNRPDQVWFVRLRQPSVSPVLLWQEANPAFYLSISRSSSGRFLLLSAASEVTRQVLLMDLTVTRDPTAADWLQMAPRQQGVQQQQVAHWQSWLFMLVVSPQTPNGELRVAPISQPEQHTVLLGHRREVELEDVRTFAHHLVLAERQLSHTTITVYCLPANSSQAALAACRYNSTAASAAEAHAEAVAAAGQSAAATSSSSSSGDSSDSQGQMDDAAAAAAAASNDSSSSVGAESEAESAESGASAGAAASEVSEEQWLDLLEGGAVDSSQGDSHLVIRGRAGSTPDSSDDSPTFLLLDPAVAVEEQVLKQQQQQQQQAAGGVAQAGTAEPAGDRQRTAAAVAPPSQARSTGGSSQSSSSSRAGDATPAASDGSHRRMAAGTSRQPGPPSSAVADGDASPPLLSPDNSWQVAFDEEAYSVSIMDSGDWANPMLRLSYTSFTTPHTILDIDIFTQRRLVRSVAHVGGGFRPEAYRSYRLWAAAPDGVEVPLSLVYRLDSFGRNGLNPALLLVYGAYGTKYDPEFDSRLLSLLDRGWVVGIAHVRGGGELGYAWHDAGRLAAKPTSFSDLAACARSLIDANLTSPSRLVVWGRSAGALTAAGTINGSPDLFHAALLDVPFLDVLGDMVDAELPLTVKDWGEWGDPLHNATLAALIASYSPVHNVNPVAVYPHMLVTAGLMDKRVGYWEAAKWVANLRAAAAAGGRRQRHHRTSAGNSDSGSTSSSTSGSIRLPGQQLLLLRTDMSGGHYSAGGSSSSLDEAALKYAFLIATLPSCGNPEGLTASDVQQEAAAGAMPGISDSGNHGSLTMVMQLLPTALQQLVMVVVGVVVAAGLMSVLWQASRVWWPAINPADLHALDLGSSMESGAACKLSVGPCLNLGREVSRRISSAAGGSSERQQQRLSLSVGEAMPLLSGHVGAVSQLPTSPTSGSPGPIRHELLSSSGGSGGSTVSGYCTLAAPAGGVGAGGTLQHQLVFGGMVDDWLLELTSAVNRSSRSDVLVGQAADHLPTSISGAQHHTPSLLNSSSSAGSSSTCSTTMLRPMSRAERRTSTGF